MTGARWLALLVLVAAAIFAWNGGSYSHRDYSELKATEAEMRATIDSLRAEADSLTLLRDSLLNSTEVQERAAREILGMIRPGEMMIKLVEDSAGGR